MATTSADLLRESDRAMFARIATRLLPFLFVLYMASYLDRINVGNASLQMLRDLGSHGLTERVFGFGSGIFFLGYAAFGIPSNLALEKFGPRRWVCLIMGVWGIISAGMMFVTGTISFCLLRLLLGVAMAGFFPGMILYLTYWFPAARRARAVAIFMTASAISGLIGGPLSAAIMQLGATAPVPGHIHLAGWQWLFLLEGIPSVVLGLVVLFVLPNGPGEAKWLARDDHDRIKQLLAADAHKPGGGHAKNLSSALADRRVWLLVAVYFCLSVGMYCIGFWLPKIIQQVLTGQPDWKVNAVTAIPYFAAAVGMVAVGRHSDQTGERRGHVAGSLVVGAIGAVAATLLTGNPIACVAALCVAATGVWGAFGPFWAIPSAFLGGTAAAGGIALINACGGLGGWVGPTLIGLLKQHYGGFSTSLWMMAAFLIAGAIGAMFVDLRPHSVEQNRGSEVQAVKA